MDASRRAATVVLAILLALSSSPARAAETGADEENILSTEVARLKVSKGTVWVRPADSLEWEEYSHNFPVAERSRVSVPQEAEAELQFRGSQFMLLVEGSEVDVLQLGEQQVSFRLRSGQVALSLDKDGFAPVRVKLPGNRDVRMDIPGRYWLTSEGEVTTLLVRAGEGSVTGEGVTPVVVKAGEEASIGKEVKVSRAGSAGSLSPPDKVSETPMTEAEQKAGIPQAAATELRQYGEWVSTPDYGYVWRPYVADGWSPYYYGQWSWVYPYGWNWVGYEPWGWWPYHYGWWVSYPAFGWVWCPFNSFFSVGFTWGGYPYWCRNAYFYSANVRFVNDGRFVRWVPERPGQESRNGSFSRNDARLAQWNRPLDSGTVMVRGRGGKPVPWNGQGVGGRTAASSRMMVTPRTGSAPESSAARSSGGGAPGSRSRIASVDAGSTRPFPDGGGMVSAARLQRSGVPLRSSSTVRGSTGGAGGQGRGYNVPSTDAGRGGEYRGYVGGYSGTGAGGQGRGYNVPSTDAGRGGEYRGYVGGYSGTGAGGQGRGYNVPSTDAGRGGYDAGSRGYGGYGAGGGWGRGGGMSGFSGGGRGR